MMEKCIWGAKIERGRIMALDAGKYDIESIDRQGVRVFGLKAMDGGTYKVRDAVYFFTFDDGHGMILGKIE